MHVIRGRPADPVKLFDRQTFQQTFRILRPDYGQTIGLFQVGGDFRKELVVGDSAEAVSPPVRFRIFCLISRAMVLA